MTILDFLVNLSADPEALAWYRVEPEKTMAAAGLSEAECQAIMEGKLWLVLPPPQCRLIQKYVCTLEAQDGVVIPVLSTGNPLDKKGLTIVGLGIRSLQMTAEARVCVTQASKVLFLVADPVSEDFVRRLNPTAETLANFYQQGKPLLDIYNEIADKIISCLKQSGDLCVVFYGHPGVLCYPTHEALRLARQEKFSARMLPGVSALDNLVADLGIDPVGLQSFEATAFLIYGYRFDTSAGLVLWQVDGLGEARWDPAHVAVPGRLKVLADYLAEIYGPSHEVYVYRAAALPLAQPEIERLSLGELPGAKLIEGATLYVPPKGPPKPDPEMVKKLGMEWGKRT